MKSSSVVDAFRLLTASVRANTLPLECLRERLVRHLLHVLALWCTKSPRPPSERYPLGYDVDLESYNRAIDTLQTCFPNGVQVEDLGRTYEQLIDFEIRVVNEPTVLMKPNGYPISVNTVFDTAPNARPSLIDCEPSSRIARDLCEAIHWGEIVTALARRSVPGWPNGPTLVAAGTLVVVPTGERRRSGCHYTPPELAREMVERTLDPLLEHMPTPEEVLALRVCDLAAGGGVFLIETYRYLVRRLTGTVSPKKAGAFALNVAETCLFGIDKDPLAVHVTRLSLWILTHEEYDELAIESFLNRHLLCADSLLEDPRSRITSDGFDAVVSNPPWVAYAGRAAQPLDPETRARYERAFAAFNGYRTLHGLFVERATQLLRPGGRLGLVLPTSVADLAGYEPTRLAHDFGCKVDPELPDFGGGLFEGVFQPVMGLLSTRRGAPGPIPPHTRRPENAPPWPLRRDDLSPIERGLLKRLSALPVLPAELFGERGYQSTSHDTEAILRTSKPTGPFTTALREGRDVGPFLTRPVRLYAEPGRLSGRLRPTSEWAQVNVYVRQTARYPIASLSDGQVFRNSILAVWGSALYPVGFLLGWLNSSPIRWLHYKRFRDARQGMPQMKIGHLRATPAPSTAFDAVTTLGSEYGERNTGIAADEQHVLDNAVADALGLRDEELEVCRLWAQKHPLPRSLDDAS